MNDSFGGGFATQAGGDKQESKAEGTLPVLIKQILNQKDDVVNMWGLEYKLINTIAVVRNIEHSSTKVTYSLEDLTGRISAHLWIEEGDLPTGSNIMLNTYARVIGAVRSHNDTKSIMIYKIQPVKGINEVNTHYLQVVNSRYQAEEYYRGGTGDGDAGANVKMEVDGDRPRTQSSFASQADGGKSKALHNAIVAGGLTYPERGLSRQELYDKFQHISRAEIDRILDTLSSDGHVYSTVDSDHFLGCN